jgi:hypothetical protein
MEDDMEEHELLNTFDNSKKEGGDKILGIENISKKGTILVIAEACHKRNKLYCESIGDMSQTSWEDAPAWQKESAIKGVEYRLDNPDSLPSDSHNSWLAEKSEQGWIWGEKKDVELKTHPCIIPYDDLPEDQKAKDEIFINTVDELKCLLEKKGSPGGTIGADGKPILGDEEVETEEATLPGPGDSLEEPTLPEEEEKEKELNMMPGSKKVLNHDSLLKILEDTFKEATKAHFGDEWLYNHRNKPAFVKAQAILLERGYLKGCVMAQK